MTRARTPRKRKIKREEKDCPDTDDHVRAPVIQWREGTGVVEVPAEQLEPFARRILEVNGEPLPAEEERELLKHVKV